MVVDPLSLQKPTEYYRNFLKYQFEGTITLMDEQKPKPGETISPGQTKTAATPTKPDKKTAPAPIAESPEPIVSDLPDQNVQEQQIETAPDQDVYQYEPGQSLEWTASEFIAHEKSMGWYLALAVVGLIIAALLYLFTKDKLTVVVVLLGAVFMGVFGARKPRQLDYAVDPSGVNIGKRRYSYDEFKSFGVIPEGAFSTIIFMPHKRFAIPINIYYPPEDEDKIANIIGQQLPQEEHKHDMVDRLLHAIRF